MQSEKLKKQKAFSLIEIIVSLAIFSFIITGVLTISISMLNAQKKIQAQLFLAQTAQTTLELMSRQIRYGYSYTGNTKNNYDSANSFISLDAIDISNIASSSATTTINLTNAQNSPFIMFEAEAGNPNDFSDQNVFCMENNRLYKVSKLNIQTNGTTYKEECKNGAEMLPANITLQAISFDIYGADPQNPKNPMIRIKMKLSHEEAGEMDVQTTVTQRLVSYF